MEKKDFFKIKNFNEQRAPQRAPYGFVKTTALQVDCVTCLDKRYITFPHQDHAQAKRCSDCLDYCTECGGEGFHFVQKPNGYRYVKECDSCKNVDHRIAVFNKAKLPARYHDKSFDNFLPHENRDPSRPYGNLPDIASHAMSRAQEYYGESDRGILFVGDVGTGKTHLLVAIIRHLTLEKGITARFIEFTHLLSQLRAAYDRKANASELIKGIAEVPVLAIDELGKGRNNDWQISVIDELISKRYNRSLTTFGTTNYPLYSPTEHLMKPVNTENAAFRASVASLSLTDRIGPRIVSRLCEMMDLAELKGVNDYRKRNFKAIR